MTRKAIRRMLQLSFLSSLVQIAATEVPLCQQPVISYKPDRHEPVYTVGVLAIRGNESAYNEFNSTFADYLTATAGKRFDPPVRFQMKPLNFVQLFSDTENKLVDFIYVNPSAFSCIESEYGAESLVSQISRRVVGGDSYDLTRFGGVIAALANNTEVNSIQDLKGKTIAAASISGLGSGQMQFREMLNAGLSYINDPRQLVFTSNQGLVVQGLLEGEFDVGFVRTDQLERSKDSDGNPIETSLFKVIDPKPDLRVDGMPFPFQSSTPLYPEWNVAALPHVDDDVTLALQEAMTALTGYAKTGTSLEQCEQEYNNTFCDTLPFPVGFDQGAECQTTKDIARAAQRAMNDGKYAGWKTTLSYMELRSMQEATSFIKLNHETQQWQCVKSKDIYEAITCPDGHFRKSKAEVDKGCEDAGLPCTEGFQCLCSPCLKGFDVDVFPVDSTKPGEGRLGCAKMSLCGSAVQNIPLSFRAVDNLKRDNANMTVVLHDAIGTRELHVERNDDYPYVYDFSLSAEFAGVLTMEIFIDGQQIPESPLRVPVEKPDCVTEHGPHFEANDAGECVCESRFMEIGGACIAYIVVLPFTIFLASAIVVLFAILYIRKKRKEADAMWTVDPEDLRFDEPPVVLGHGNFGLVELAFFHGTHVAVKRVLPQRRTAKAHKAYREHDVEMGGARDFNQPNQKKNGSNACLGLVSGYSGSMAKALHKTLNISSNKTSFFSFSSNRRGEFYHQLKKDFIKEMRLLSRLRHPSITTVMGAVIKPNHEPLLVMEWCELGSLYDLLHNETMHIQGELLLPILRDIVQGVRFLHSTNPQVIHADLKSKNVLITSSFRAKVADFGLSPKKKNTKAVGTPYFMAPELLRGETTCTTASDIYALGIVFYELYARKDPYEGLSTTDVLKEICDPSIDRRPHCPPECPPEVAKLMKSCWDRHPLIRPTAEDLDERLKLFYVENVEPCNVHPSQFQRNKPPTNDFLYKVFPRHVADALSRGEKVEPQSHPCVTVFFCDVVNYTVIASSLTPLKISSLLDRLYATLDSLCEKYDIFKVETVGDAFMCCSNLIQDQSKDHVKRIAEFSMEAIQLASAIPVDLDDPGKGLVQIRVGFHSGPVVSNVVGSLNPRFGLFGDSVNIASRMESNSKPSQIQCSEDSAKLLAEQAPDLVLKDRGFLDVKGKGMMRTFWVGNREGDLSFEPIRTSDDNEELDKVGQSIQVCGVEQPREIVSVFEISL